MREGKEERGATKEKKGGGEKERKAKENRGAKRRHNKPERADFGLVRVGTGYVLMGCQVVVGWGGRVLIDDND